MKTLKQQFAVGIAGIAIMTSAIAGPNMQMSDSQPVHFALGTSSVHYDSTVGRSPRDYVLHAAHGQTLSVDLDGCATTHFDILTPQTPTALYNGTLDGHHAVLAMPTDGQYIVRVYQDGNASGQASFQLGIAVTGTPAHVSSPPSLTIDPAQADATLL
ncbi:MAG: hypothetical protein QM803_04905 [Rhodocyclaceae bacterium]